MSVCEYPFFATVPSDEQSAETFIERHTDRSTHTFADSQMHRVTDRQTDRNISRHTDTQIFSNMQCFYILLIVIDFTNLYI